MQLASAASLVYILCPTLAPIQPEKDWRYGVVVGLVVDI
jgi:hypothetical protein